jgi:hypothetical protein
MQNRQLVITLSILTYLLCGFSIEKTPGQVCPGGVCTDLELWLKADAGTTGDPTVTDWSDQSSDGNDATANGNPQLVDNARNYNQSIAFDGSGDYFIGDSDINSNTNSIFIVGKMDVYANTGRNNEGMYSIMTDDGSTYDGANPASAAFMLRSGGSDNIKCRHDNSNLAVIPDAVDNEFKLLVGIMNSSDYISHLNGESVASSAHSAALNSADYYLGCRYYNSSADKYMTGEIAEIIHFEQTLSASDQQSVETYLSIKYGISLSGDNDGNGSTFEAPNADGVNEGDYVASDGTIVWDASDNSSYHNNIIGIGRDDDEELHQKQSALPGDSTRIYLGYPIAADNSSNSAAFGSDDSYVVIGDNQETLSATTTSFLEMPASSGLYTRIAREWRIERSKNTKNFNLDIALSDKADLDNLDADDLSILFDDDGDFSSGTTTTYANGDGSGIVISYSKPYVTIQNIDQNMVPNNSARMMTIGSTSSATALPVELLSFEATCREEGVELLWVTMSESGNDGFEIQRSIMASDFETIGFVPGNGTSNAFQHYGWTDSNFPISGAYYRLKQFDFNGAFQYSNTIYVASGCISSSDIFVFPNPTEGSVTINLSDALQENAKLQILDHSGRVIFKTTANGKQHFHVDDLRNHPDGVYFIEVKDHHSSERIKLVKQ